MWRNLPRCARSLFRKISPSFIHLSWAITRGLFSICPIRLSAAFLHSVAAAGPVASIVKGRMSAPCDVRSSGIPSIMVTLCSMPLSERKREISPAIFFATNCLLTFIFVFSPSSVQNSKIIKRFFFIFFQ